MLTQSLEEIRSDSCARRRDGVAAGIRKIFLDPLLNQNRAERASEAGDQTEGPQHIHGDVQVAGLNGQDIRNGKECCVSRLGELKRYLPE